MSQDAFAELDVNLDDEVLRLGRLVHTNHDAVVNQAVKPNREPKYYKISREKWAIVESAHDVRKQVEEQLSSLPVPVRVGVTTDTSGHRRRKVVSVQYLIQETSSGDEIRPDMAFTQFEDHLPASATGVAGRGTEEERAVEDIPVKAEKVTVKPDFPCDTDPDTQYYDTEYFPDIPGGCYYIPESGYCTTGTPAHDDLNDELVIVGAGHCLDEGVDKCYQNDEVEEDRFGTPDDTRVDPGLPVDAGVIQMRNGANVDYSLAENTDSAPYGPNVFGIISGTKIKDREGDTSWEVKKQGANTGICSGHVTYAYGSTFDTDAISRGGDSGGPHYREDDYGRPLIAGINYGHRTDGSDDAIGTLMSAIESQFNVTV
ncbi:S1 family peptidase [Haloferax sp. AB510]|uniref:S1 family peptidase n=1 Tax=Haloferax sp. AB510 TaxID=2934172 RepID=UPI00209C540A|nr:S1 family peptidase [Haloferax sp. AB510]MCO8266405.1 S1 family peptidase [Haloferax sp. AB510]